MTTHNEIFGETLQQGQIALGQHKNDEYLIPPNERLRPVDYRNARRTSRVLALIAILLLTCGFISRKYGFGNYMLCSFLAFVLLLSSAIFNLFSIKTGAVPRSIRVLRYRQWHSGHH